VKTLRSWAMLSSLVLSALAPAHAQERMAGRLFFTPEQRDQLDAGRRDVIAGRNRPAPSQAAPAPKAPPPQVVTLHGVVKRSDGEATVWVNGRPVSSRFEDADIGAGTIARDSVGFTVPGSKRRVRLKVGQSLEAMSGTIEEGYRRRRTLQAPVGQVETPADPAKEVSGGSVTAAPRRRRGGRQDEVGDADPGGDS
jgi:hypothetical protein